MWRQRTPDSITDEARAGVEQGLARNETFFRRSNELLVADAVRTGSHRSDIICECASRGCVARITMTIEEYRSVRATGERFAIVVGHENPLIEDVVERHPEYLIVRKRGEAGAIARASDTDGSLAGPQSDH